MVPNFEIKTPTIGTNTLSSIERIPPTSIIDTNNTTRTGFKM